MLAIMMLCHELLLQLRALLCDAGVVLHSTDMAAVKTANLPPLLCIALFT